MKNYLRVIPQLTAISETTKGMVLMENIQKHREDVCRKENKAVDRKKKLCFGRK